MHIHKLIFKSIERYSYSAYINLQVVFANNPISGLLITISLGVNAPGTLLLSAITGSLGLLLSVVRNCYIKYLKNDILLIIFYFENFELCTSCVFIKHMPIYIYIYIYP